MNDFTQLPDLASRALSGSVVHANDELFAERENLIKPGRAVFSTEDFGHKGKVYDGWETRRRREAGHDFAIVRLGVPGVVRGVVIDTSWFKGNYPPFASVEGASVEGYPSPEELLARRVDAARAEGRAGRRHRQPVRGGVRPARSPTSACRSIPTEAWRGSACTASPGPTRHC